MTTPAWVTTLSALLTPTIAILGGYIAYRQWRTAQNKLKLELFERRLETYRAARDYIGYVIAYGKVSQAAEAQYLSGIKSAKWLFDPDVGEHLEKLWKNVQRYSFLREEAQQSGYVGDRAEEKQLGDWIHGQQTSIDTYFVKYLSLTHA